MLAADKLQLQSSLKQQATALKEKEFNLHHSNLMTVGTQAAVLAGLDITMFIEFQPPHDSEWGDSHHISRAIKFIYYVTIVMAFCSNILVVSQSTALSVLGSSLALRGPDGSMISATDGMYEERKSVFLAFGVGLGATVASTISAVWLILSPEAAIVCVSITIFTCFRMYKAWVRITRNFCFDESETVDFTDIFEGPAAIMGISTRGKGRGGGAASRSRRWLRGRSSVGVAGEIKDKESSHPETDDSLSSDNSTDKMIPKSSHSVNNRGGGYARGTSRRRSPSERESGDYDLETGSRNSAMQTV